MIGFTSHKETMLPVLPLRDIVVFPHMIVPLFVGREKSVRALENVMKEDKQVLLVTQKSPSVDDPNPEDLYMVGTVGTILQLLKLPDGTVKVLVEGSRRVKIKTYSGKTDYLEASIEEITDDVPQGDEVDALSRAVVNQFEQYVKLNKKIPPEVIVSINQIEDIAKLADTVSAHLTLKIEEKQDLLETPTTVERLEKIFGHMEGEIGLLQVEKRIRNRVKRQMEKTQREYYLNEQMKAIQKELGDGEEGTDELGELDKKIEETKLSKEAHDKAKAEMKKLRQMSPMSAEATVVRNYLDWILSVPWNKRSRVKKDIQAAKKFSIRIISAWKKSRNASLNISPSSSAPIRSAVRSSVSSVLPVSVRHRWASRLQRRPTAISSALPLAACAMNPKSAVTAGPISGPCRARLFRA